ncbi:uncharacterized protein LOC135393224 [Ornithodoros turicata]|uniref:uncharacterized protein LOC135393224 n=1 Tax=Ornithodoros turicata TaxID=34597 RepID=UPI003138FC80
MKLLLACVAAFIVVCRASYYGQSLVTSCEGEYNFTEVTLQNCNETCVVSAGSPLHLNFTGRNHEEHPVNVSVWAHIRSLNHTWDSFYYNSTCENKENKFPCTAAPGQTITGQVKIDIPKDFKKAFTSLYFYLDGIGCAIIRIIVSTLPSEKSSV